jgi:hypothetical protein
MGRAGTKRRAALHLPIDATKPARAPRC